MPGKMSSRSIYHKEFGMVCRGGDHSKKIFMFKGIALYADPSLRQVQLNNMYIIYIHTYYPHKCFQIVAETMPE